MKFYALWMIPVFDFGLAHFTSEHFNCSQQNGELIFGISLEMSLKANAYLDIHWSNQMNILTLKTTNFCRTTEFKLTAFCIVSGTKLSIIAGYTTKLHIQRNHP